MGYMDIMKSRLISSYKAFGFSVRTILQARKKLPASKSAFYLFIVLLPLLAVVFVDGPVMALTWLIGLFIVLPIIDAYAYAVVNGSI
jgi:diacylglycerol kinase